MLWQLRLVTCKHNFITSCGSIALQRPVLRFIFWVGLRLAYNTTDHPDVESMFGCNQWWLETICCGVWHQIIPVSMISRFAPKG